MKLILTKDAHAIGVRAADIVENRLRSNAQLCLGTVTGASPESLYQELARRHRQTQLDFSHISTVNTDEYLGLSGDHPQSYRYYLEEKFFRPCGIAPEQTAVPQGDTTDPQAECARYEAYCRTHVPDLQILGIGHTGHIGFNEPEESFPENTHIVSLQQETIAANSVYFAENEQIPTQAITVGIGAIMRAKEILMLISGSSKADIARRFLFAPISPWTPGTVLRFHPKVTVLLDEAAAARILEEQPELFDEKGEADV